MRKLMLKEIIWLPSGLHWLQGSEPGHETILFDYTPVGYQKYSCVIFYQAFSYPSKVVILVNKNVRLKYNKEALNIDH